MCLIFHEAETISSKIHGNFLLRNSGIDDEL